MAHTPSIPGRQCCLSQRCRPHIGLRGSIYGARCGSNTFASKTLGLQERGGAFQQTRSSHSNSCLRCQSEHAAEGQVAEGAFQAAPGADGTAADAMQLFVWC